jgi:RNA polymerase sigma-70 factor (ECF subfamily)
LGLVQRVGAGDQLALHALYERMDRIVFTLIVRIVNNHEAAEEVTVDVFHDVWRRAATYDPAGGSVVGWIMNQARSRAIDRLRYEQRKKRVDYCAHGHVPAIPANDPRQVCDVREQGRLLRDALKVLTADERQAIETAFFSELTYHEVAERFNQPPRDHQDANPFRAGETPTGACRNKEAPMSSASGRHDQDHLDLVFRYALHALPASEVRIVEAQIATCADCRQEIDTLRPIVRAFVSWPTDLLRPSTSPWERLAHRIAADTGSEPMLPTPQPRPDAEWEEAASGLSCKMLATDTDVPDPYGAAAAVW